MCRLFALKTLQNGVAGIQSNLSLPNSHKVYISECGAQIVYHQSQKSTKVTDSLD